jgi:ABC-type lipoprotein export system ATPase subunit
VQVSDAHKLADLFKPAHDRFCWLKADPTFEGLRQILYEPADRVFIGPTPPLYHDEARVISAVRISHANGWIDDITIPLNPGLVAIVGQKGSGKSALAELMSYAAGSWREDATSFLRRAGNHLDGLTITLQWADGATSTTELWGEHSGNNEVRYLSQKFVERLCAEDQIGSELVREIEAVIFSYIDPTDTLNASDFEELRALRTEGIRSEGEHLQEDINRLIREECALRANAVKLREKEARIQTLAQERDGLLKQMPQPATKEEAQLQQDLQAQRNELGAAQQLIAAEKQKLQKIADVKTRLGQFRTQALRFHAEIDAALKDVGVPDADRQAYRLQYAGDTEAPLTRRATEIQRAIDAREGAADNPAKGTVRWLEQQIKFLMERDTADKARQQRIRTIQTRLSAIGAEVERLTAEIAQIKGPERARLDGAREERLDAYVAYFENLKRERDTLEELYEPIKKKLTDGTAAPQEQELEFSIRWQSNLDSWLERGSLLFDQRTSNPYGTIEDLRKVARERLLPAWASGDPAKIRTALDAFVAQFRNPTPRPEQYLRAGVAIQDVLEWMYSVDHVRLSYGLKYNGVELEKLSPGTKGIVLLILYLGMDTGDTRPLLVDQPDENLDNESIYALLTTYFKSAKRRRQIVLITHNPNLVVNGDAEQVIVATATRQLNGLPHMAYTSGALENTSAAGDGIRDHVCRILEGGTDAFRKREKRYGLARL